MYYLCEYKTVSFGCSMIYIPAYEPHRFLQIYQHYAYTFIVQIFG